MTRILLVHQPTDGGVARHVADLAHGLVRAGFEPVTCGPARIPGTTEVEHVKVDLGRALTPRGDLRAVGEMASVVRRLRPALVHGHSSKAGAVARLARWRNPRVPVLYTPHGYAFAGYFRSEVERRIYRELERGLTPLSTRILCVCEAEAALARSIGARGRVRVVHNGIEPPSRGVPTPTAGAPPTIAVVTLLRPGKGLETLIDAVARLVGQLPGLTLRIYGDGPDQPALRERVAKLGIADAVRFEGFTDDPLGATSDAAIVAFPSWAESFPYAILEAMAGARPIVATDVGGIGEAITNGLNGLLVPPRDVAALADALKRLIVEPDVGRRMGAAARETLIARFTTDQMVAGTSAVYSELL